MKMCGVKRALRRAVARCVRKNRMVSQAVTLIVRRQILTFGQQVRSCSIHSARLHRTNTLCRHREWPRQLAKLVARSTSHLPWWFRCENKSVTKYSGNQAWLLSQVTGRPSSRELSSKGDNFWWALVRSGVSFAPGRWPRTATTTGSPSSAVTCTVNFWYVKYPIILPRLCKHNELCV